MTDKQRAEVDRIDAMLAAPRMLVPDARTESEFNSGKPPSYPVVVQAPNGMFVPLQDAQGRAMRFVGDPDAALAGPRAATQAEFDRTRASDAVFNLLGSDASRKRDARNARRAEAGQ